MSSSPLHRALPLVLLGLTSCAAGEETPETVLQHSDDWVAIYGPAFTGVEDDQALVQVMLTRDVAAPCSTLFGVNADEPSEFTFVRAAVGGVESGRYEVASPMPPLSGDAYSVVGAVKDGRSTFKAPAFSGTVEISQVEWSAGATLEVRLDARYPKELTETIECSGAASADKEFRSCKCRRPDQTTFTCEGSLVSDQPEQTCCQEAEPPKSFVDFSQTVQATYCPDFCHAVPGSEHRCLQLRESE